MKHENLLFLLEKAVVYSGLVMPVANSLIVCLQDSSVGPVCVYLVACISIATSFNVNAGRLWCNKQTVRI